MIETRVGPARRVCSELIHTVEVTTAKGYKSSIGLMTEDIYNTPSFPSSVTIRRGDDGIFEAVIKDVKKRYQDFGPGIRVIRNRNLGEIMGRILVGGDDGIDGASSAD